MIISVFYVDLFYCPLNPKDSVNVSFNLNGADFIVEAGVVRVDENGAGIAFRALATDTRKKIKQLIGNLSV